MVRFVRNMVLALAVAFLFATTAFAEEKPLPRLVLIGDSTVKNGSGQGDGGLFGWGQVIDSHFDSQRIEIENRALGGRSSRTYLTEGLWEKSLARLRPGDFVMMQFGHNDSGQMFEGDRPRASIKGDGDESVDGVVAATGKQETVHSYGWYLRKYIADAKAKGAVPIVLSPVPRNRWDKGRVIHADKDYGLWARQAAQQAGADFIDLNELVSARYDQLGEAKVGAELFTEKDWTHTNRAGAIINAACVVDGVKSLPSCTLKNYLTAEEVSAGASASRVKAAVAQAHENLWRKFIGREGLIHDYVGEIPTPEDCELGRPNAIGWWSPIENGPMFTGTYLAAMCERARRSGAAADREQAKRLAAGLLKCASVSDVPGFIARGVGTDGQCHYPMGSQDQTHPWFYGMEAYANSGIPTAEERKIVVAKMIEVANALEAADWKCPCDGAFAGETRGDFLMDRHHGAVMYLHILKGMHQVTGDPVWLERYHAAAQERIGKDGKSRIEICAAGYPYDRDQIKNIDRGQLWIYVSSQGALSKLAQWETDPQVQSQYRAALAINAQGSLAVIGDYETFDNNDDKVFGNARWREGYPDWFPQTTQADAEKMASRRDPQVLGERKHYEVARMRNPLAAAAIIALAGYEEGYEPVRAAIRHYDYAKLNMAEFFFAEVAYYALPTAMTNNAPQ